MKILLILCFSAIFLCFGYFIMARIDSFLAQGGFEDDKNNVSPVAVVFGKTDLTKEVTSLLRNRRINVLQLNEPFMVEQGKSFCYLFALSDNDTDNIILCKIGGKIYGIEKMICICNDRVNIGIFKKEMVPYLLTEGTTAQMLYEAVLAMGEEIH